MSTLSLSAAPSSTSGSPVRILDGLRTWFAARAERRQREAVGISLIRSGDREMIEIGRQILGGRPVAEVFADC